MQDRVNYFGKTFGEWLVEARKVPASIRRLSEIANSDPSFPRRGDIEAVRQHVRSAHADNSLLDLLPVAENHWLRA